MVKKTFYVDADLVKRIKIKSAVDSESESQVVDEILRDYFSQKGQEYILKSE